MTIRFTKMHGLGNDFIVLDAIQQHVKLPRKQIIELAKRDTGIGFDQCLIIEPGPDSQTDFFYRIFNADGNEVGQCANGARCVARFVEYYGLTRKKSISVATNTTRMILHINSDESVTVDMGCPKLDPADIPLSVSKRAVSYELPLSNGTLYSVHAISVGNPHAVSLIADTNQLDLDSIGKELSEHPRFPQQANVGFMEIIDSHHIRLRVYERGCGETKACGSGAAAAAAIGRLYYQLAKKIRVSLPGGELVVEWPTLDEAIYLNGPAAFVYEGALIS
jgi:diaminopimelate epimerase